MKRKATLFIIAGVMALNLLGCNAKEAEPAENTTEESAETAEDTLPAESATLSVEYSTDIPIKPDESGFTGSDVSEGGKSDLSGGSIQYVEVENPSWDYYCAVDTQSEKEAELSLQLISQESNQIIDTEEWFVKNDLMRPAFPYNDGAYHYEARGFNSYETYILDITNMETGQMVEYDFSEFQYADNYVQEDFAYICQKIFYAQIKDNILYVATGHQTYAKSCPQTAYITAIDLAANQVLWKTAPLTCNSNSFVLTDQYIICGYGFTEEPDSLKIVDIGNGKVVSEIPVKSAPEYIILKGGKLFARTYNTDYVYEVIWKNEALEN